MPAFLQEALVERFGPGGEMRTFFAPGRVNLIGEHTDYNGGHVFPCALQLGTYAAARRREDETVRLFSLNVPDQGTIEFQLAEIVNDPAHGWANYPKGVLHVFRQHGYAVDRGMDVVYYGDIPLEAGLSSSAALELATSVMLNGLFELEIEMLDMVKMSQQAENEFVGVSCGIMDQFASGMGKKDRAMLLDCSTLDFTYCPVPLDDASLIIANTNKQRGLTDSKYNERRSECEEALRDLQQHIDIETLGDLTAQQFNELQHHITRHTCRKRAQHAVYENRRTIAAVQALSQGDIWGFGELMNISHVSLRDDYEVTGKELDSLVHAAWDQEGVIGSRMTGAGFGGCTISIVKDDALDAFKETVGRRYREETGLEADFYVVEIGAGARELT